jgi:hypothetical protein
MLSLPFSDPCPSLQLKTNPNLTLQSLAASAAAVNSLRLVLIGCVKRRASSGGQIVMIEYGLAENFVRFLCLDINNTNLAIKVINKSGR